MQWKTTEHGLLYMPVIPFYNRTWRICPFCLLYCLAHCPELIGDEAAYKKDIITCEFDCRTRIAGYVRNLGAVTVMLSRSILSQRRCLLSLETLHSVIAIILVPINILHDSRCGEQVGTCSS